MKVPLIQYYPVYALISFLQHLTKISKCAILVCYDRNVNISTLRLFIHKEDVMRKIIMVILVILVGWINSGCGRHTGAQYGLRGYPNAPHQRVQPLYVDQNVIYNMSPAQFNEYKKRINWATDYNRKLIRNDVAAANAAKSWTGSTNSYHNDNFGRTVNSATRTFSNELSNTVNRAIRDIFK